MTAPDRVFVDTNVFVASLTSEPARGTVATGALNLDATYMTALLNLMELRTVLTKKKEVEQDRVEAVIRDVESRLDVVYHEPSDLARANELQTETLLYPMDCMVAAVAEDQEATLVTFDAELQDAGATSPKEVLDYPARPARSSAPTASSSSSATSTISRSSS